jgi:hypothetical protein
MVQWDPFRIEEALARCVSAQYIGSNLEGVTRSVTVAGQY